MGLAHVNRHSHHQISRLIIALGISVSISGSLFIPIGLGAPTIDDTPRMQGRKNDAVSQPLSDLEIQSQLEEIPGWELNGNVIQSQRVFRDFVEAIAFVNRLIDPAEAAGHHPDISISYNRVTIMLTTHDVGGLTEQDFELAAVISEID